MAVIDALPGIETAISLTPSTRYVEATTGQNFEVVITAERGVKCPADSIEFDIYVDGVWVADPIANSYGQSHLPWGANIISQGRVLPDASRVNKYSFADLRTDDERNSKNDLQRVQDLGTIKIKVGYVKHLGQNQYIRSSDVKPDGLASVSEKAIKGKALSHGIAFSAPDRSAHPWIQYKTTPYSPAKPTLATFIFKYRSLKALKSQMIIPRTPSPEPLEDRDVTTLNHEELRELQKRARAAKESALKPKIKRERSDDNPRPRKAHRPAVGDTQLEIDEDGRLRESSTTTLPRRESEIIVLD